MNPFRQTAPKGLGIPYTEIMDADGRIRAVRQFTVEQCKAALALPNVQKVVRLRLRARLIQLDREVRF